MKNAKRAKGPEKTGGEYRIREREGQEREAGDRVPKRQGKKGGDPISGGQGKSGGRQVKGIGP